MSELDLLRAERAEVQKANDWLQQSNDVLRDRVEAQAKRIAELEAALARYRKEVPLGHQPHMFAHEVDLLLGKALS